MTSHGPRTDNIHADIVRRIAAARYPFPDQTDWPESYRTLTNAGEQTRGVETTAGTLYPEIVIVDSDTGTVAEIGVVVSDISPEMAQPWRQLAALTKMHPGSGAPHFFIYVPEGQEAEALRVLQVEQVPFGGLRTYLLDASGALQVTPVITPVDPKDHRPT
jgi:hypothetical protein